MRLSSSSSSLLLPALGLLLLLLFRVPSIAGDCSKEFVASMPAYTALLKKDEAALVGQLRAIHQVENWPKFFAVYNDNDDILKIFEGLSKLNMHRHFVTITLDQQMEDVLAFDDTNLDLLHAANVTTWEYLASVCMEGPGDYPDADTITCTCLDGRTGVVLSKVGNPSPEGCYPRDFVCDTIGPEIHDTHEAFQQVTTCF